MGSASDRAAIRALGYPVAVTPPSPGASLSMKSATFGARALQFYEGLTRPRVPAGIEVMNPYRDERVRTLLRAFCGRYFADNGKRTLILGINPGRFGAGITGITFTDPVALADDCGIANDFQRRRELSSVFVYDVIRSIGGPTEFYRRFFLSAVCPLGFVKGGLNYNYYDDARLEKAVTPFIARAMAAQVALGARRDHVVVLGAGKNLEFVRRLNDAHGFFGEVHALEHPRWIMQYRRKRVDEFLARYQAVLATVSR